jgi:hypothetical protein
MPKRKELESHDGQNVLRHNELCKRQKTQISAHNQNLEPIILQKPQDEIFYIS